MDRFGQDWSYAMRMLRRNPTLTATVILCIGLAIGLNGMVFSVTSKLLTPTIPVEKPEELVRVYQSGASFPYASFSYPNYVDVRDNNTVFSGFTTGNLRPVDISSGGSSERATAAIVGGNYFDVLGVGAVLGRPLAASDDVVRGGHPVAVLSHSAWQERWGGATDVVGREFLLNGSAFTIIGVAPPGFVGTLVVADVDLWVPLAMEPVVAPAQGALDSRGSGWLFLTTGRLRDGVSVEQASAAMDAMAASLREEHGWEEGSFGFTTLPIADSAVTGSPEARGMVVGSSATMLVMVAIVLLVACGNVANLLLARSLSRRAEMNVRLATGASRWQLIRQLLTESLVLGLLGGAFGLVLTFAGSRLLPRLIPDVGIPLRFDFEPDVSVVLFTFALTVATAVVFGLFPALRASRTKLSLGLRSDGAISEPGRRFLGMSWSASRMLVVAQVALSLLLLVGSALFLRALGQARTIDPGFATSGVLVASLDPSLAGMSETETRSFYEQLDLALSNAPGVREVSFGEVTPFTLGSSQQNGLSVEGYEEAPDERMNPDYNVVHPGYFEVLDIPLIAGRGFRETDTADSHPVLVVSEAMAKRYWDGREPLGGRVRMNRQTWEVIGVAQDVKWKGLGQDPEPYLWVPAGQYYEPAMEVVLATDGDPMALAAALRTEVGRLAPGMAVNNLRSIDQQLSMALFPVRTGAQFLGGFGLFALLLAAVGLYGVLSFSVSQRRREIGIRMALGSDRPAILRWAMRDGMVLTAVGLVLGLVGALLLSRLLASQLYGLNPRDPAAFGTATIVLLVAGVLAAYLPAKRAASVDPWLAIRNDG